MINANIMGTMVCHLLGDGVAFCNILFKKTLDQLNDFEYYVEPCEHIIRGFRDATVKPHNIIRLAVELVFTLDEKARVTKLCDFLVIDMLSSFNEFLNRLFEQEFEVASSTYYSCVKFPTKSWVVSTVKGAQVDARGFLILF